MHGLKQKVLLLTIFPILLIFVVLGTLAIYNEKSTENELFFGRFNSYRFLLESGNLSLSTIQDKSKLEALINEKVILAEILKSDYSVVYTTENSISPATTEEEKDEIDEAFQGGETIKWITRNGESVVSIITPLIIEGKVVAALHQIVSNAESSGRTNRYTAYVFVFLLVGLIVCYIIIFFLLNRNVLKNIYKLKQATIKIKEGNLSEEIKITSKDEISDLADAFNQMAGELRKNRQELENYNKKLEEQIKERTKNLEIAEKKLRSVNSDLESKVAERTSELEALKNNLEKMVSERTVELNKKMAELEKMNKFMVDRELKMVELKKKIKELELKA